jgi:hypothetical protein
MKKAVKVVTPAARQLTDAVVRFVNLAWGRHLRSSLGLAEAVQEALDDGYTEDQVRAAYWSAACQDGFIRGVLTTGEGGSPELCLRHKGGTNNETGKAAKRWLDLLWETVGEMRPTLITNLLADLVTGERIGGEAGRRQAMSDPEIAAEHALLERIFAPLAEK